MNISCVPCRLAKQKCSRSKPCVRCADHKIECHYPNGSFRGRKRGSKNKQETVGKLVSRITQSALRDEVIALLLGNTGAEAALSLRAPNTQTSNPLSSPLANVTVHMHPDAGGRGSLVQETPVTSESPAEQEEESSLADEGSQPHANVLSNIVARFRVPITPIEQASHTSRDDYSLAHCPVDTRLSMYFDGATLKPTDWALLATHSSDDSIQLRLGTHDPLGADFVDSEDASRYFHLFFDQRNPFVGVLDPSLHTVEFVYSRSFTLFSVICALGCALSDRQKDRLKYTTLLAFAESNIRWSMAYAIKTVEIIQAIINFAYWAPLSERLESDPTWLRISHAILIARDIGIDRSNTINTFDAALDEMHERMKRNIERTWLYIFIVEKSFGVTMGRQMSMRQKDISLDAPHWWHHRFSSDTDRLVSGTIEMRLKLQILDARKRYSADSAAIDSWRTVSVAQLIEFRDSKCLGQDNALYGYMSVLEFCLNHAILFINAQAAQDVTSLGMANRSMALDAMSQQNVATALRLMDIVLFDPVFQRLKLGIHNTQLLMLCHAAIELMQVIDRGLPERDIKRIMLKLRMVKEHLETVARMLPSSSWMSLYARLFKMLIIQAKESPDSTRGFNVHSVGNDLLSDSPGDFDNGILDITNWLDVDSFGSDAAMTHDWR